MNNKEKAIVIDGNSLMFRAFYATYKQLDYYREHNVPFSNAIRTMVVMLNNLIKNETYKYGVIAFDHKEKSFRAQMSDDYKAGRKKTPEELVSQIEPIKQLSDFMGFKVYCIPGIEADDVVGSVAKHLSSQNIHVDIFSSDRDLLQLVDSNINVSLLKSGTVDLVTNTIDNFGDLNDGLKPHQIIEFKALAGDTSDNIPGVPGIGKTTAIKLINEFDTIENIYENLEKVSSKSVKAKLESNKESAFFSKKLATILIDQFNEAPITDFLMRSFNKEEMLKLIEQYNLNSLRKLVE